MKPLPKITLLSLLLSVLFIFSCVKEPLTEPSSTKADDQNQEVSHLPPGVVGEYYTPTLADFAVERSSNWVSIPGGSVDALEAAIDGANPGAIIYLKAGTHTLNSRLTITKPIKIIGEEGAELLVSSDGEGNDIDPGIHFLDAPGSLLQNVDITNTGEDTGWNGVLFENSHDSGLLQCTIDGFRIGVIIEFSDRLAVIANSFLNSQEEGLLLNNGKSTYIGFNNFKNVQDLALWVCDKWNTVEGNTFDSNGGAGILLCNFPGIVGYELPSGTVLDASSPSVGAKLRSNEFKNNDFAGLSIRDGSYWSLVESSNTYTNNGVYDISIPADEDFPGIIFIPAAYDNTVHATEDVLIKDCGINNTVVGGTLVDTNVDPC